MCVGVNMYGYVGFLYVVDVYRMYVVWASEGV